MSIEVFSEVHEFPRADDPTPRDLVEMQTLGQRLAEVAHQALQRHGLDLLHVFADNVMYPLDTEPLTAVVQCQWRGGELLADKPALEILLATCLGFPTIEAGTRFSPVDRVLAELPLTELVREVQRAVGCQMQAVAFDWESASSVATSEKQVHYMLHLQSAHLSGRLALSVSWPVIRTCLEQKRPAGRTGLLRSSVSAAAVQVEALFDGPELSTAQLRDLQAGDIIQLGPKDRLVTLWANGVPVARGRPGAQRGRLAVSICYAAGDDCARPVSEDINHGS